MIGFYRRCGIEPSKGIVDGLASLDLLDRSAAFRAQLSEVLVLSGGGLARHAALAGGARKSVGTGLPWSVAS